MFLPGSFLIVAAVALASSTILTGDFERMITAFLILANTAINMYHFRHIRKEVEPKIEQTRAITVRKLGDRETPQEWAGDERREA